MVQVAVELIEAVRGGQEFVFVAQMVLTELAGHVAVGFEDLGNGGVLGAQPEVGAGHADFTESGAEHALPGDE